MFCEDAPKQIAYDKIRVGDRATLTRTVSEEKVKQFAEVLDDRDSFHVSDEAAKQTVFRKRICHGLHIAAFISEAMGKKLPGFGTIYLSQTLSFIAPVYIGETVVVELEVLEKLGNRTLRISTTVRKKESDIVITGEAVVKAQC